MSLLEGGIDWREVHPVRNPYGEVLRELAVLGLEGAMDIAVDEGGETSYIAGRDALVTVSMRLPEKPEVLGVLRGIGNGRQIEVRSGIAYITSRPDGLSLCDVRNPKEPKLLYHYDTVELATGVWTVGNLCFVTCRHFGVEILDVSDPSRPVYLSSVPAGEAQSVFSDGQYMYVGAWISREVLIFDIQNPRTPVKVAVCSLDGFGDGVFVRGNLLFAATGHHARRLVNRRKYAKYDFVTEEMLQEGYGGGHGLEIFDITDRAEPKLLSRLKTPPIFTSGNDMWDVAVSGEHAFLADTHNGVFIINIADPCKPFFAGYYRLSAREPGRNLAQPPIQQLCSPITGIAVIRDYLLAVSPDTGLHVLDAAGKTGSEEYNGSSIQVLQGMSGENVPDDGQKPVFKIGGQIHACVPQDDFLVAAAGDHGLYVLRYDNGKCSVVSRTVTTGFAIDVKTDGRFLYVAEGAAGFSVWDLAGGRLREVSRWRESGGESVRQVVLYGEYGLAALHIGVNRVAFVELRDPFRPILRQNFFIPGMMYYKNIAEGLLNGRYAAAVPLSPCTFLFDLENLDGAELMCGFERELCPIEEGVAFQGDRILTVYRGSICMTRDFKEAPAMENRFAVCTEDLEKWTAYCTSARLQTGFQVPEGDIVLSGRPKIIGNTLYLINRLTGLITGIGLENISNPVYLGSLRVVGNPEDINFHSGAFWISSGHGGLIRTESLYPKD